jgi:uncharacterized protein YdcH (DUF465 family)
MASTRKPVTQFQIDRLERRHSELKAQIAELDRHAFLSQQEQLQVTELKKERLAAKDALVGLKRHQ